MKTKKLIQEFNQKIWQWENSEAEKNFDKSIKEISSSQEEFKNKVEFSLFKNEVADNYNDNWKNIELMLAEEFWLTQREKERLEKDYKKPLTLTNVMNQAEKYFKNMHPNLNNVLANAVNLWKRQAIKVSSSEADDYRYRKQA